jgi:hypothetical protein
MPKKRIDFIDEEQNMVDIKLPTNWNGGLYKRNIITLCTIMFTSGMFFGYLFLSKSITQEQITMKSNIMKPAPASPDSESQNIKKLMNKIQNQQDLIDGLMNIHDPDKTGIQIDHKSNNFQNYIDKNKDYPKTPIKIFGTLPESSVWCHGNTRQERICKFRNLCYNPVKEDWFILKTSRSVLQNVPTDFNRYRNVLLETSSVTNHSVFFWVRFN